jgi:V8-like Glu-specific endopeptidase
VRVAVGFVTLFALSTACADVGSDVSTIESSAESASAHALARGVDSTRDNVLILDGVFPCSAVLIAPRVVLSARHCVADRSTGAVDDVAFSARFGPLRDAEPELEIAVREVRLPVEEPFTSDGGGQFLMEMNGRDLAVAILEEDAPFAFAPIVRAQPEDVIGTTVTLAGYGITGDAAEPDGVRRETDAVVTDASGVMLAFASSPLCAGDSGGPAFSADGTVLGIHSFGAGTAAQCGQNLGLVNGVWGELAFIDRALNTSDACPSGDLAVCDAPIDNGSNGSDNDGTAGCGGDAQVAFLPLLPLLLPLARLRKRLGMLLALLGVSASLTACAGADVDDPAPPEPAPEVELVSYGLRECPAGSRESLLGNPNVVNALIFARIDAPAGVPLQQVRVHTVWSPTQECRCDAPHRISVFRSTALRPEASPARVFSVDVPGVACNVVGEVTASLDEPLVLAAGEVAYVAVEMTGTGSSMTCVASCSGSAIESGFGGTTEPAPYQYVDLVEGGTNIAPRFELLGPAVP